MVCVLDARGLKSVVAALNVLAQRGLLRGGRSLRLAVGEVRVSETGRTLRIIYARSGRPSVAPYRAGEGFSRGLAAAVGRLEDAEGRFEVESALSLLARCGLLYGGRGFSKRVEEVQFDACGRLRIKYTGGKEHVTRGKARLLINLRLVRLKMKRC